MNIVDILNSMCENIAEQFDSCPIYIQDCPESFKRPSFYIKLIGHNDTDATYDTMQRLMSFQIVYFAPRDDYNSVDTISQLVSYETLISIFQVKSLQVKNRYLKIDSIDGGMKDAEVYMTLRLDYTFMPELLKPAEVYQLMEELKLKYSN